MKKSMTGTKWLLALVGLLMLIVGLFLFFRPIGTMVIGSVVAGVCLVISAIFYFVGFFFNLKSASAGWMLIAAILNFLIGMLLMSRLGLSIAILIFIFGVWAVALGAVHFANSFALRHLRHSGWGWQLVGGLIGILIGLIIIFNPLVGFVTVDWVIAFGFVFYGVANMVGAGYTNLRGAD